MEHYGCHVDAPRLRCHAGKKRVLFSVYLGFSIPSRCLSFSLAVELAAGSRK
jgi:hypothetical protein